MPTAAVFDEIRTEIVNSLYAYDFSTAFPAGYTGTKATLITEGWPFDLLDNMLAENDGQMTRPILAVLNASTFNSHRSLGMVSNANSPPSGKTRYATRIEGLYIISCFADMLLGGMETVEKLGGLVLNWTFQNMMALTAFRQLRVVRSSEIYEDRPQIWRTDVEVEGYAFLSYDV